MAIPNTSESQAIEPTPFKIAVPDSLLSFIDQRVSTARIPPGINLPPSEAWSHGIPPDKISHLRDYWEKSYDWRSIEARLNSQLKMFTLPILEAGETITIHFVHHRSSHANAIPLLFQHGWPGSFLEVTKIINLLTSPSNPGAQAYHVIAPSLPGFSFSSAPQTPEFRLKNMAIVNHKLMLALGYKKYMAQGGDWGSMIVRIMGAAFPENCIAVHVNMVIGPPPLWWRYPFHLIFMIFWAIWQGKDSMFKRMLWWMKEEAGYQEIQGTKPQTLSYALTDSPVGMLAWIREKIENLVDDDYVWQDEEVITWAMMYIIPGTAGHASIYKNTKGEKVKQLTTDCKALPKNVDFGVSVFPKDVVYIPKWWAACSVASNIVFWNEHAKGGHFPSVERPDVLVKDIRDFTEVIDAGRRDLLVRSGKLKL